ncbi:hypothetical protein [Zobellia galactanivorans]|uniref:Uncharacterized protein n=1 Tax=Zobellia galactanivorans (strain DSM 12802 / CCUG 47099 / CIP 106680 / NCIMB 13871 / Dsij) TaxID=63186 RepID=G0LBK9_ZOBGA|nr:hypothetical protein [Zobellia galactanivorans]CAZ96253.1 Putative protein [Zobellia galactanivorans]
MVTVFYKRKGKVYGFVSFLEIRGILRFFGNGNLEEASIIKKIKSNRGYDA